MFNLESKKTFNLNRRVVQNFMDIIILKHLKNMHPASGYDLIKYLHKRFHMLPSPGTIYSMLYSLERQSLIEGRLTNGKRVYELTDKGEKSLENIRTARTQIQTFLSSVLSEI